MRPDCPTKLIGCVTSGLGDYGQWICKYAEAYSRKTGLELFPGTLNVQLREDYVLPTDCVRLEDWEYGGRVNVSLVPCWILGHRAVLLRTDANRDGTGPHPLSLVEVATDVHLRQKYQLEDGDTVIIETCKDPMGG